MEPETKISQNFVLIFNLKLIRFHPKSSQNFSRLLPLKTTSNIGIKPLLGWRAAGFCRIQFHTGLMPIFHPFNPLELLRRELNCYNATYKVISPTFCCCRFNKVEKMEIYSSVKIKWKA